MNRVQANPGRRQALAVFCLPWLWAAGQTHAAGKPKVGLVMKSLTNEFFQTMGDSARAHQREHAGSYELSVTGIDNENDVTRQIKVVEGLISARTDAIVIVPADSKQLVPVLKRAIEQGIVVVNIDNKLDDQVMAQLAVNIPFVGPSNRQGTRMVGEALAKHLKPGDEVAIIEGPPTAINARARTIGFQEAMQQLGASVVAVQSGYWEIDKGTEVASQLLSRYPRLRAILCGNDNMAIGAVTAIEAAGRAGRVLVVGYDNIPSIRPLLADGRVIATAEQFAGKQAVFGIELALKALQARTPQTALPPIVPTPVTLVTR